MNLHILKFALLFAAITAVSCGGDSPKSNTHTHSDGTVHEGAAHSEFEKPMPKQESFKVEADTLTPIESPVHNHEHENHEHGHDHSDCSNHKH